VLKKITRYLNLDLRNVNYDAAWTIQFMISAGETIKSFNISIFDNIKFEALDWSLAHQTLLSYR